MIFLLCQIILVNILFASSSSQLNVWKLSDCISETRSRLIPFLGLTELCGMYLKGYEARILRNTCRRDYAKSRACTWNLWDCAALSGSFARRNNLRAERDGDIDCIQRRSLAILRDAKYALIFQRVNYHARETVDEERYARAWQILVI